MEQLPPAPVDGVITPLPQLTPTGIVYDLATLAKLDGIQQFVQLCLRLDRHFPNDEQRKIDTANATQARRWLENRIQEAKDRGMKPIVEALEAILSA